MFSYNDIVRISDKGMEFLPSFKSRGLYLNIRGRVTGYSRKNPECVCIERLDTPKHYHQCYHESFLVKCNESNTCNACNTP